MSLGTSVVTTEKRETSHWQGVLSMAVGAFVIVTTEFLPIGLLTPIRQSLQTTEGGVSWAVTLPGLAAAVVAPILTTTMKSRDRRWVLIGLSLVVAVSNIVAGWAPNLPILLSARALLGVAVGGFWTFALSSGRRLVKEADGNRATAIVTSGMSLGIVFGLPIGTAVGQMLGWRRSFFVVAGVALVVALIQMARLPEIKGQDVDQERKLRDAFRNPNVRLGLWINVFVFGGQFAAYTFLEPYLRALPNSNEKTVDAILVYYGIVAFLGAFVAEWAVKRFGIVRAFLICTVTLSFVLTAAALSTQKLVAAVAAVGLWGALFSAFGVFVPVWMYEADPSGFEGNSALLVTTAQVGVASGAAIGGALVDHSGLQSAFFAGSIMILISALLITKARNNRIS